MSKFYTAGMILLIGIGLWIATVQTIGVFKQQAAADAVKLADLKNEKARQELRDEISSLAAEVEKVKGIQELDHKFYGNRGIIQQESYLKLKAHGWFSPDEVRILDKVAEEANYPK
jgi:hypothetical protein